MTATKRCSKCGEVKPLSEFNKTGRGGLRSHCRVCGRKDSKRYNDAHVEKTMVRNARGRAKERGTPFAITEADIIIPETCPVLGIKLERRSDGRKCPSGSSPTLDCIDPTLGYVPGNVWVLSHRANRMKQDMSPEGLLEFATKVYDAVYCTQDCAVPTQP